jgi:hypothetical protein
MKLPGSVCCREAAVELQGRIHSVTVAALISFLWRPNYQFVTDNREYHGRGSWKSISSQAPKPSSS